MMSTPDVLIFVEDPGAANYIAPLPATLAGRGWRARLLTTGSATSYLAKLGVHSERLAEGATAREVLAAARPRLLIVGTAEDPDTLGLALVAEARTGRIQTLGVVDALPNADLRFRGQGGSPLAYAPDWLLVPDEWTKEAFVALGYPVERTVMCGHPHYDYVLATGARLAQVGKPALRQRLLPHAPRDRKVVTFVSEASYGLGVTDERYYAARDFTLTGRGVGRSRTDLVLEEFLDAAALVEPRPYLVLRLHPRLTPEDFQTYLGEFDLVSSAEAPLELVFASDLVVGMTSMLLSEATLLGQSTLSILPRVVEREWLPDILQGVIPHVTTRAELRLALGKLLRNGKAGPRPCNDSRIQFGAVQRVTDFVSRLLTVSTSTRANGDISGAANDAFAH